MKNLEKLLIQAFENKSGKIRYKNGEWEVAFANWGSFEVYKSDVPVLAGDYNYREIILCTSENICPYDKLIETVSNALPEYQFCGELYERYLKELREEEYLHIIDKAIGVCMNTGTIQILYLDTENAYQFCSLDAAKPSISPDDIKCILGDVSLLMTPEGKITAGFEEYSEGGIPAALINTIFEQMKSDFVTHRLSNSKLESVYILPFGRKLKLTAEQDSLVPNKEHYCISLYANHKEQATGDYDFTEGVIAAVTINDNSDENLKKAITGALVINSANPLKEEYIDFISFANNASKQHNSKISKKTPDTDHIR